MKYALGFEKDISLTVHHTTWEAVLEECDTLTIMAMLLEIPLGKQWREII